MINEELATEKLKYLLMTETGRNFEILDVGIDFNYTDYDKRDKLEEYDVDITFDYLLTIDSQSTDFGIDIHKMSEKLRNIILKYTFNSEGKIVKDSDSAFVDHGMIWKVDFIADTKHVFEMSFRVTQLD
jgi:hypothetical protein